MILGPEKPFFPIGVSDFAQLRRGGYAYVDKTRFVAGLLDSPAVSMLFPRPRRFGKTLNLTTARCFLERTEEEERSDLFRGTHVWEADEGRHRAHFQRYPVFYLTFKDVKRTTWSSCWSHLRSLMRLELERLVAAYRLEDIIAKSREDSRWYKAAQCDEASPDDHSELLPRLARWLYSATGEPMVILIDEYDAPLHAAFQYGHSDDGYWDEAIAFLRAFLSAGFKDEAGVFRGVLTGILRVAKENIFSGLNNVRVHSLLHPAMSADFGFTEAEVIALARSAGCGEDLPSIRRWYNGYEFGGRRTQTIYNPWSVLMFASEPQAGLQAFWKNTSSNELVSELLIRQAAAIGPDVERLIAGESIERVIDESVALEGLRKNPSALWSLLTFSGYLSAESAAPTPSGFRVTLRIPNEEVRAVYHDVFARFLEGSVVGSSVDALLEAMLGGDTEALQAELENLMRSAMSSHDFGQRPVEAIYQALLIGLLVRLDPTHRVMSNREAGHGRADILVVPRAAGTAGAVLELKVVAARESPEQALERAVFQLRDRDYAAEVRAAGATEVHEYGVVFDGKRCWVAAARGDAPD